MVEDYTIQLTKTGGNKMVQEGYSTVIHATEDLTDGYLLTEAVTKYVERATQAEESMK